MFFEMLKNSKKHWFFGNFARNPFKTTRFFKFGILENSRFFWNSFKLSKNFEVSKIRKTICLSLIIFVILEFGKLEVLWSFKGIDQKEVGIIFLLLAMPKL